MVNYEGGAIPEEYQTEYVVDRVEATSAAFLGLTMGCARCHGSTRLASGVSTTYSEKPARNCNRRADRWVVSGDASDIWRKLPPGRWA